MSSFARAALASLQLSQRAVLLALLALPVFAVNAPATAPSVRLIRHLNPGGGLKPFADIWAEADYAYMGSLFGRGVWIIDISKPGAAHVAGHYDRGTFADVKVANGIGYFSNDQQLASEDERGLHIVDVSDAADPVRLSQLTEANGGFKTVHNSFIAGEALYVVDNHGPEIRVFDVANPSLPRLAITIVTPEDNKIHDVTVINDRLYASDIGLGQTLIYDVNGILTAQDQPDLLATIPSGSGSHSSWVNESGTLLASAREVPGGDVRLYDLSDLDDIRLVAKITAEQFALEARFPHNPVIMGDYLFVAWYESGLQIFNIADPSDPIRVGAYDTYGGNVFDYFPGGAWGVYPFSGFNKVLVSDLDSGFFILDASEVAGVDSDGDRLPDQWELAHGLAPDRADSQQDEDQDGQTNLAEFLAGTAPNNPSDVLRVRPEKRDSSLALIYPSKQGRSYTLQVKNSDPAAPWSSFSGTRGQPPTQTGTGQLSEYVLPITAGNRFFGLVVRPANP